jgi:nicotinamide-nucleotide adenylyltransferase
MQVDQSSPAESIQDPLEKATVNDQDMAAIRKAAPELLKRLQDGLSSFELVYTPHPHWPLRASKSSPAAGSPLRISVLDSSFNPPTKAHLGLANSQPPFLDEPNADYDARLLLLSVKNADKTLKPGDARYEQRIEMMSLLAKSMNPLGSSSHTPSSHIPAEHASNTAIGIIDEPIFAGKSSLILSYLEDLLASRSAGTGSSAPVVELTFLVGLDTLERLFSTRYYASESAMMDTLRRFISPRPEGEGSRIVCAGRAASSAASELDPKAMELAQEFIDSGRISIIDMGNELSTYSSTTVRQSLGSLGQDDALVGSWRKLVTKDVAEYIVASTLYQTEL